MNNQGLYIIYIRLNKKKYRNIFLALAALAFGTLFSFSFGSGSSTSESRSWRFDRSRWICRRCLGRTKSPQSFSGVFRTQTKTYKKPQGFVKVWYESIFLGACFAALTFRVLQLLKNMNLTCWQPSSGWHIVSWSCSLYIIVTKLKSRWNIYILGHQTHQPRSPVKPELQVSSQQDF